MEEEKEPNSALSLIPMHAIIATAIVEWHYEGEYAFYDMEQDPEELADFMDPNSWPDSCYAVLNEKGNLVGFFTFEKARTAIEIGLGLHPDATGKALGLRFVLAGLAFARQRYTPSQVRLRVATFNRRAIKV